MWKIRLAWSRTQHLIEAGGISSAKAANEGIEPNSAVGDVGGEYQFHQVDGIALARWTPQGVDVAVGALCCVGQVGNEP